MELMRVRALYTQKEKKKQLSINGYCSENSG